MKILVDNFAVSITKGKNIYTTSNYKFTFRMSARVEKKARASWADGYCGAVMHDKGTLYSVDSISDSDAIKFVSKRVKSLKVKGVVSIDYNGKNIYTKEI